MKSFGRGRLALVFGLGVMVSSGCGEDAGGAAKAEPKASAQTATDKAATSASASDKKVANAPATGAPTSTTTASTEAPASSAAPAGNPAAAAGPGQLPKGTNGILPPGEADKLLPVGGKPVVTVLDKGAEPRESLVYDLSKGQKDSFGIGMDMTMKMDMGGRATPPIKMPRMNMLMELVANDKNPEKDVFIEGLMKGVTVDAGADAMQKQLSETLKKELDGLKGLKMTYWVSPKGEVRDSKLVIPPSAPASAQQMMQGMLQSMDSMVAPLPKEDVGVGAKWSAITRVMSNGADFLQLARYTLKQKDGTKLTFDVEIEQVAAKGTIDAPGLPPGVKTSLKSIESAGKGTMVLDLKQLSPVSSQTNMALKMSLHVEAQGKQEDMSMEMGMGVEFTHPKK